MSTSSPKPFAAACERNRDPILEVLRRHLPGRQRVLEVGSGTGQHAVYFAAQFPTLQWQTTERAENLWGVRRWLDGAGLENTPPPLELDVGRPWPAPPVGGDYDAVFSANTLHIMAWEEVCAWFAALPAALSEDALLIIYGPFNVDGRFTSDSNAAFDASLRARAAHMGIRDRADVDALAATVGFQLVEDVEMPANNRCRIWQRRIETP